MGIQVQPNCCGKWIALSNGGTGQYSCLYDLNINTGKLSNPRILAVLSSPVTQGGIGPMAYNPFNKKAYSFGHALAEGATSYVYEIDYRNGRAIRIGALAATTHYLGTNPHDAYEGISGTCMAFNGLATVLYASSTGGSARRNSRLMTINPNTGARITYYTDNFDGSAIDVICSDPLGLDFHPVSGIFYCWNLRNITDIPLVDHIELCTLSTLTGRLTALYDIGDFRTMGHFPLDMKFLKKSNGDVWAYSAGSHLQVCKDVTAAVPVLEIVAPWTGKVLGSSETIFALAHIA